jgi:hypothetical protein
MAPGASCRGEAAREPWQLSRLTLLFCSRSNVLAVCHVTIAQDASGSCPPAASYLGQRRMPPLQATGNWRLVAYMHSNSGSHWWYS